MPVEKAGSRDGHADAGLLRQIAGDRRRVAGRLLVAKAEVADAFGLRQAQEIGDRDAGHAKDRVDPVQLQRLHHQVKAVRHVPRHILCAHIVPHSWSGQGLIRAGPSVQIRKFSPQPGIVRRKPRFEITDIAGRYLEGPVQGGGSPASRPPGSISLTTCPKGRSAHCDFRLAFGRDVVIQNQSVSHALMLRSRHHDVTRCRRYAARSLERQAPRRPASARATALISRPAGAETTRGAGSRATAAQGARPRRT